MIKARGIVQRNLNDGHTLEIEWEEDFMPFEVPIGSYIKDTIKEVTNKAHIQSIWYENGQTIPESSDGKEDDTPNDLNLPKNQILYGPPGTGKTFSSITKALSIIENIDESILKEELRSVLKERFDKLLKKERIHFSTFHQSMSYEDFIEGIKPITKGTDVIYEIEDGIFKKIADEARINWLQSKNPNNNFEVLFEQLKKEWQENENSELRIPMKSSYFDIIDIREKNIDFRKSSGGTGHDLVISTLKDIYLGNRVMESGLAVYYYPLVEKLKTYKTGSSNVKLENYVLIIDEINRGNVSQIFGELITLIEEDKRLGKEEALEVTLPYSKEKFGVPPNLYIVGTMNTADRSVEALDTALRRRFSFEEMPPKTKVVEKKGFSDYSRVAIMEKINNRIEVLLDRNHTLGHAYFIKTNFKSSFENEIIPLLQEYFYNDYGKIGLVLGKGFVREKAITAKNDKSIFADFDTKNDVDINKSYELIPFTEVNFDTAIQTLLV
jgi:5-methylcytosine-specific restriction protein B